MMSEPSESSAERRSLLRRLWHTPVPDLLRGRISGRLDWRSAMLKVPGLEPEFRQMAVDLLARMRIGRRRRARWVGRMNAQVFFWQISGQSPLGIEESAGGPGRLANLLRRQWTKEEPWRMRLAWSVGKGARRGCFTIGVAYTALAILFFTGGPSIDRNFTAEYNATFAAVPRDERAWPLYREAVLRLPTVEDAFGTDRWRWPDVPFEGEHGRAALEYLEHARESIEMTRRAAARPVYGRDMTDAVDPDLLHRHGSAVTLGPARLTPTANPALIDVVEDDLGVLRELAKLLVADARAAALAADGDRLHADAIALSGMADHAQGAPTLIAQMSGFAIAALLHRTLAEAAALEVDLLSEAQLEDLAARLAAHAARGRPDLHLDWERNIVLDFAQRMFTDDGAGDGRICLAGMRELGRISGGGLSIGHYVLGPLGSHAFGSRRQFVDEYDRLIGLFKQDIAPPIWEQPTRGACADAVDALDADPWAPRARRIAALLLPGLNRAAVSAEMIRQDRDAALLGLAAELHRRRTGAYPESVDALADRFPAGLPPDWIDGRPLRYALRDGRPTVYSLGPDRDDDGGRLPEGGFGKVVGVRGPGGADGDLVLWPRGSWIDDDAAGL